LALILATTETVLVPECNQCYFLCRSCWRDWLLFVLVTELGA